MNAANLRLGDTFVESPPHIYAELTRKEQRELRVWTVKRAPLTSRNCPGRVHIALEGATWCISSVAEVTRVEAKKKERAA